MNVFVYFSSANFLYFTSHLLNQNVCDASVSLYRDGKFKYAHFRDHLFHILDVPKLEGAIVPTRNHCLQRCVKNPHCFSANTAAFCRPDGNMSCDLLPADKFSAPDKFRTNHSFHHYSIVTSCESFPCQNGGTCQPLYHKGDYTCNCSGNVTGKNCDVPIYRNCKEIKQLSIYQNISSEDNKAYFLRMGSDALPVYCHMTNDLGECGDGGWTLVMKINGSKKSFNYYSILWSNMETVNPSAGKTGLDFQETKLPTYWSTPFSKICLGMKVNQKFRSFAIHKDVSSLHSLMANGQYHTTSLGRDKWKSLIGPEASLQRNCNKEGFNVVTPYMKARIGIVSNQQNDCGTCDSKIGFGLIGYPDVDNTCGNAAKNFAADNGDKRIKAMGYIFVQ